MSFPELVIDRNKLVHNVRTLIALGEQYGIQIHFITKALCAWRPMVEVMHEAGCEYFGDSRVDNIAKINDIGLSHMLVRIPMMSEVKNVVRYADLSLNSDLNVIAALSDAAMAIEAKHGIILMVEMGDLREGFMLDEMMEVVGQVIQFQRLACRHRRQFQLLRGHYSGAFTTDEACESGSVHPQPIFQFVFPSSQEATPVHYIC